MDLGLSSIAEWMNNNEKWEVTTIGFWSIQWWPKTAQDENVWRKSDAGECRNRSKLGELFTGEAHVRKSRNE